MSDKKKIVVVGSGISGILAGLMLVEKNDVTIIDREKTPGGLLRSYSAHGFDYDYGTHFIMETLDPEIDALLFDVIDDNWKELPFLKAGHYFGGVLNSECPHIDARNLPHNIYEKGVVELLQTKIKDNCTNLKEQLDFTFGQTLTEELFKPVLKKFYNANLDDLATGSHGLISSRIIILNAEITNFLKKNETMDGKISYHSYKQRHSSARSFYPKKTGIGLWVNSLMKKFTSAGGTFIGGATIKTAQVSGKKLTGITLSDETDILFDSAVCTISPFFLMNACGVTIPPSVKPPKMIRTVLLNLAYDKPFLTNLYFLNCFEPGFYTFRVTLYSNLRTTGKHNHLTVECLLHEEIENAHLLNKVKNELQSIGVIESDSKCVSSSIQVLDNGFPTPLLSLKQSSQTLLDEARSQFSNVIFCGKGTGETFFLQEVIRSTYEMVKAS